MCLGSSLTTKYFAAIEFVHNRTGQKTTYRFIMVCTDLPATGQNCLTHWKARIWLSWISKNNSDTPTKTDWSWAQLQKGQPTPCKTTHAFPHSPLCWDLATNLLPLI